MERYLIDTNIVSDFLSASIPQESIEFIDKVVNAIPNLSAITHIELLCWKTDAASEQKVKGFIADSTILNISQSVIENCVDIRRNKRIKIPDAIIAATALAEGYTLLTNNEKDFIGVEGLKIINPHKL